MRSTMPKRAIVLANSGRPFRALESIGDFPRETETTHSFTAHLAMAMRPMLPSAYLHGVGTPE